MPQEAIQVRDDLEVRPIPTEDVFGGRTIALAYSSKGFTGAGIYLTPLDAVLLARALLKMSDTDDTALVQDKLDEEMDATEADLDARSTAYHDHPSNPTSCQAYTEHYKRRCPCESA